MALQPPERNFICSRQRELVDHRDLGSGKIIPVPLRIVSRSRCRNSSAKCHGKHQVIIRFHGAGFRFTDNWDVSAERLSTDFVRVTVCSEIDDPVILPHH